MTEDTARRDWNGRHCANHGAFYNDICGQAIVEHHRVGRVGATLITADQSEGGWSDAPTPMRLLGSGLSGGHARIRASRARSGPRAARS